MAVAEKFQAQLVLDDLALLEAVKPQELTLPEYAEQWLATDVALQLKSATEEKYTVVRRKPWLPKPGVMPPSGITREKVKRML